MRLLLVLLVLVNWLFAASPVISGNYESGTFDNGKYPLLFEMHNMTVGKGRPSFIYPSRNPVFRSDLCDSCFWKMNGDLKASGWNIGFSGEISTSGFVDSVDFDLSVKLNWIRESKKNFVEVDGESVHEIWDDGDNWINYTRYRGHVGYNYSWLRLELGRDAMHWGPGYYNNLTLNRQAIPYNYFSAYLDFGLFRVVSFYSKLRIDSANVYTHKNDTRNLYGHRYELSVGNATIAVNELQLIYNENNSWLFAPVVPLFIEKGNYSENNNNGAISFDASYRFGRFARVYGEFFLDDMDSPIAVVKSKFLDSEWAWMIGAQISHDFFMKSSFLQLGSVIEISRIEQLVYTHYASYQGQMANAGFPLGGPLGPNSRTIDFLMYGKLIQRNGDIWIASLKQEFLWKGNNYGSQLNENIRQGGVVEKREYLGGAKMKYRMTTTLAYESFHWGASADFGYDVESCVNVWVKW